MSQEEARVAMDLNAMSLADLKRLQKDVAKAISDYDARKKAEARAVLEEKARDLGYSLAELAGASSGRKRAAGGPKYRHPENPDVTWTGRGRKPKWVAEHIAAGRPVEALEI